MLFSWKRYKIEQQIIGAVHMNVIYKKATMDDIDMKKVSRQFLWKQQIWVDRCTKSLDS